ncbi:tail fiber domain-containing protein [Brevundimonas sp. BH3]|uniref:tail fiber domain-containing protein n=1 Tax=Brevundimonas sp. BH3 TaxID=3133089 RepID=UPI00324D0CD3
MSITTGVLAQQIADLIERITGRDAQLAAWAGGTATGGPNGDGKYPLSDATGAGTLLPSPAALAASVLGPADQAKTSETNALAAAIAAKLSEDKSADHQSFSEAARGAAIDARDMALIHRNHAGTHEANARYWAELAQGHGSNSTADREIVELLAAQVQADAIDAEQYASDAAASAALAATFNPSLYDLKSDTLAASRLTGLIDVARIPILPSQKQFASSGGLTALTTAQQNEIGQGSIVTTTDGNRWVYSGSGSKTVAASYVQLADVTPEWSSVTDKPSFFPSNIANVSGLQSALDGKASMADIQWTNSNVATKANLTGGNVFKDTQKIEATSSQWGLWIESAGNVPASGDYTAGVELMVSSFQPRIMFHDRSTNAKHMIQHYNSGAMRWMYDTAGDGLHNDELMKLQGNGTLVLKSGNVLTTGTGVQIANTNLGATSNVPLIAGTRNAAWWAGLATGYNVMTNLTTANGSPINGHGYFMKMARRDADNGWCGLWQSYTGPEMYFGGSNTSADMPNWYRLWNSGNFNPDSKLDSAVNGWRNDTGGHPRFWFGTSGANMGTTYYRGSGHEWRSSSDTQILLLENNGVLHTRADAHFNGTNYHNSANHFNADTYINGWHRVNGNGGIYWQAHAGGWFMQDTTWLRSYNNKGILTTGTVQMGAFTVTSDRRIKTDFAPIKNTGSIIDQTAVYEFTKAGKRQLGVIAQEAQEIVPVLVSEGGELHTDGTPLLTVDMTGYIPIMLQEMKSMRNRLAELEGR